MKASLTEAMLYKVSEHIAARMGLKFPPSKWPDMERAFSEAANDYGFRDEVECAQWFLTAPLSRETIESMAGYLTIGETYFLREPQSFKVFEQVIVPEIVRLKPSGQQRLRIWSAACSSGEEPYTIAILLHRMRNLLHDWDISILASDINIRSLHKAKQGEYGEWSFRNTPSWFKDNYFSTEIKGRYKILDSIREMVNFAYINLAEDPYPSLLNDTNALDVIFCRNLLMYFTPDRAQLAIENFHKCLVAGGWFMVSPCDVFNPRSLGFTVLDYPGAIVCSKREPAVLKTETFTHDISIDKPPLIKPQPVFPPLPVLPAPVIKAKPNLYEKAQALYAEGLYSEATDMLAKLLSQDPNDRRAMVLMCRIYANEGKLGAALHLSEQAIAADKLNVELHFLHAVILQEQGMVSEAIEALKKVLYLDQNMVLAYFTLGNLSLKQGKKNESRQHFNNALELLRRYHPDDIIPDSDGLQAGRLMEIIKSTEVIA